MRNRITKFAAAIITLALLALAITACAQVDGSKGLDYTSNGDGTCSVSGIGQCTDTDIQIPTRSPAGDRVTAIGKKAFAECETIQSVSFSESVNEIGIDAFYKCTGLTSVTIPGNVKVISHEAFRQCTALENLKLEEGVTEIRWYAFEGCTSLIKLQFPSTVSSIDSTAFSGCSNILSIDVAAGNPVFHSAGNCLIKTSSKILYLGCQNSVIPTDGTVTYIGDAAFYLCQNLTKLDIPACVKGMGKDAFNYCQNLESIVLPDGFVDIPEKAFLHCDNMKSIAIPGTVTKIYSGALGECASLEEITFGGTVEQWKSIDYEADWCPFAGDFIVKCTDGNT